MYRRFTFSLYPLIGDGYMCKEEDYQEIFYANRTHLFTSANDFLFKFQTALPTIENDKKSIAQETVDEIIIATSPQHFKRIFHLMKGQLEYFEKEFGIINIAAKDAKKKKTKK